MSETPKDKPRPPSLRLTKAPLTEWFRRYATPSPFHKAVQQAARRAGWTPPWDREEQQRTQGAAGGKTGGVVRRWLPDRRRDIVKVVHARLKPRHQYQPYSDESIDAFIEEYRNYLAGCCKGNLLTEGGDDFTSYLPELIFELPQSHQQALMKVGREALIKDMKALGIRSKRRKQRAG
jgi:hypothetical protein